MPEYQAIPKTKANGGVIVLHAWWGLNDFFKGFCDRLAGVGYIALAPDLYNGAIATTIPEAEKLRSRAKRDIVAQDILQAVEQLQTHPAIQGRPIGVIGFSLGAYWSLWLAEKKPEAIAAAVLFYGTRGGEYKETRSAFLGYFAETDDYVTASGVKKLEKTLKAAGKEVKFTTYPGTSHWFFENNNTAYNSKAAALAWNQIIDFLHSHL